MRKRKFLKSAVITFVFLLTSSAAVPVFASYAAGDGASSGWGWNNTAIGENASTTGWQGTAIGTSATSSLLAAAVGYQANGQSTATAVGSSAAATGGGSTAIGYNSSAPSGIAIGASAANNTTDWTEGTVIIGADAKTAYSSTTLLGQNTETTGGLSAVAGTGAQAAERGTAYGYGAKATATKSTAIGTGASANATNSVALGSGSVADRANTVSVGSAGNERQITNVADGTAATDVINVRQLNEFGQKLDKVGAMSAAISALRPMPHDPKAPLQLLAGGGNYSGRWAAAVGIGYYAHEKFLLKLGIAFCASEKMGQLGLEWKWGRVGKKAAATPGGNSTITALQAAARQLQAQLKQQQDQTQKQQNQQQNQLKQLQDHHQEQLKQLQDQIKRLLNTQENPI